MNPYREPAGTPVPPAHDCRRWNDGWLCASCLSEITPDYVMERDRADAILALKAAGEEEWKRVHERAKQLAAYLDHLTLVVETEAFKALDNEKRLCIGWWGAEPLDPFNARVHYSVAYFKAARYAATRE